MGIKNGDLPDADEVLNFVGKVFKNQSQLIFNADYIGFDSKLNAATGVPDTTNLIYDTMTSDTADTNNGFVYDATNDLYVAVNTATFGYFAIVEASSYSGSLGSGVDLLEAGKWIVYDTGFVSNSDAVQRAKVHETLWGASSVMLDFTTVTALKVSEAADVGFRGHYATYSKTGGGGTQNYIGTPANTSTNLISSWSNLLSTGGGTGQFLNWEIPAVTVLNAAGTSGVPSNEIGTDRSADEATNPATVKFQYGAQDAGDSCAGSAIIFCKGDITWALNGNGTASNIDYFTDHSIPDTTAYVDELEGDKVLIFENSSLATITNCLLVWNSDIDAANTLVVSASSNGSAYEAVTETEVLRFAATSTNLHVKFTLTTADDTKEDKISAYATMYNN